MLLLSGIISYNYTNKPEEIQIKFESGTNSSGTINTGVCSWYSNTAYIPTKNGPWIVRGGNFTDEYSAGIFNFNSNKGISANYSSTRAVISNLN